MKTLKNLKEAKEAELLMDYKVYPVKYRNWRLLKHLQAIQTKYANC